MKIILLLLLLPVQLYSQVSCCDPYKKDTATRKVAIDGKNFTVKYIYGSGVAMMPAVAGPIQPHYSAQIEVYDQKGKFLGSTHGMYVPDPGCFEDDPKSYVLGILNRVDTLPLSPPKVKMPSRGLTDTLMVSGTISVGGGPVSLVTRVPLTDTIPALLLMSYYSDSLRTEPTTRKGYVVKSVTGTTHLYLDDFKQPIQKPWYVWEWKRL